MSSNDPKGDFSLLDDKANENADDKNKDDKNKKNEGPEIKSGGPNNNLPTGSYITQTPNSVGFHPIVLLSVVDHYARVNQGNQEPKRVMGLLLGQVMRSEKDGLPYLDISNCFGVPFDEEVNNSEVWFLDSNFAERMYLMFKKVYPKLKVVGWYSSGPTICPNDMSIHNFVTDRFCPTPVYCIVDTNVEAKTVPVLSYVSVENRNAATTNNNTSSSKGATTAFRNVVTNVVSVEAEDIGVEALLRDLSDSTVLSLTNKVQDRMTSADKVLELLEMVEQYLRDVADDTMPANDEVLAAVQELLNARPVIHRLKTNPAMAIASNDESLYTFVASLARSIGAIYETIVNRRKVAKKLKEMAEEKLAEAEKERKEKEEKEKEKDNASSSKTEAKN